MTLQLAGDMAAFKLDDAGLQTRAKGLLGDQAEFVLAALSQGGAVSYAV